MSARSILEAHVKSCEEDVAYHREELADAEGILEAAKEALAELDTVEAYAEEGRTAEETRAAAARGPRG